MTETSEFADIPTTTLADLLGRDQVMDIGIRPVWGPVPRVAGPAFIVRCPPGDNLMLHAAIHRAPAGSVIVVESGASTTPWPVGTCARWRSGGGSRGSSPTG